MLKILLAAVLTSGFGFSAQSKPTEERRLNAIPDQFEVAEFDRLQVQTEELSGIASTAVAEAVQLKFLKQQKGKSKKCSAWCCHGQKEKSK